MKKDQSRELAEALARDKVTSASLMGALIGAIATAVSEILEENDVSSRAEFGLKLAEISKRNTGSIALALRMMAESFEPKAVPEPKKPRTPFEVIAGGKPPEPEQTDPPSPLPPMAA